MFSWGYRVENPGDYKGVSEPNLKLTHIQCGSTILGSYRSVEPPRNPCRICSRRQRPLKKEAIEYVKLKGGKLIEWSDKASCHSTWECAVGHRWKQRWSVIRLQNYWCKECVKSTRFKDSPIQNTLRAAKKLLHSYVRRDKDKRRDFDLTVDDVLEARSSPCCYCGRPATGLDRKNNDIGHIKKNCVPSCLRCNWMRGRYVSYEVMLEIGKLLSKIDP